jgi:hypothetical protein
MEAKAKVHYSLKRHLGKDEENLGREILRNVRETLISIK